MEWGANATNGTNAKGVEGVEAGWDENETYTSEADLGFVGFWICVLRIVFWISKASGNETSESHYLRDVP